MSITKALLSGVIQGLTEFLPVSSSGHLVIFSTLLDGTPDPLVFDLILHIGTLLALIYYFRFDLLNIFKSLNSELSQDGLDPAKFTYEGKLGLFVLIGSLPAAILGYFLEAIIEDSFRSILAVAITLFIGSLLMLYAEIRYSRYQFFKELTGLRALAMGFFQSLALFPGMSRSGATISGGMLLGLHRENAARFSFLMSIPVIVGATIFKFLSAGIDAQLQEVGLVAVLIGLFSSFVVGYFSIDVLLKMLKTRSLYFFIAYRTLLVIFLLYIAYF